MMTFIILNDVIIMEPIELTLVIELLRLFLQTNLDTSIKLVIDSSVLFTF